MDRKRLGSRGKRTWSYVGEGVMSVVTFVFTTYESDSKFCCLFCRPALMTIVDGRYNTCVHVGSKMMEQILLNISPDCLNRVIGKTATPSIGVL